MNIIKEFGSYEKAKKHQIERALDGLLHEYDFELVDALLEYRREHGIYEVGDKIVYLDEPILRSVMDVKTVKLVKIKSLWAYSGVRHDQATEVYFCQLRHATDLEIKAGHRLP